jgi:hypothetical protein
MKNRRYCSVACRQRLRYQLDIRTGLLKALNTRYATFYFTSSEIFLDILLFETNEINSFIFKRRPGAKPVDDFIRMCNQLGYLWWAEKRRTAKRYLASRMVLGQAEKRSKSRHWIYPGETLTPSRVDRSLSCLRLSKADLDSSLAAANIKSAFRKMAKQHHPDQGGEAATFRRVHEAYQQLMEWCKSPTFHKRRGFRDKWFYDGYANRWIQPVPK